MIGDMEKLFTVGQQVELSVMGKIYVATVIEIDISNFERKYLISFSDYITDTKWVNNTILRQFIFNN
jgi:hypothetical protein